jgi:hypothetical protein
MRLKEIEELRKVRISAKNLFDGNELYETY